MAFAEVDCARELWQEWQLPGNYTFRFNHLHGSLNQFYRGLGLRVKGNLGPQRMQHYVFHSFEHATNNCFTCFSGSGRVQRWFRALAS